MLLSYFTLLPKIFEAVLPFLIYNLPSTFNLMKDKLIMGFGIVFLNFLILLCYNVAMIFIYKAKHPFFEKYRVNHVIFWVILRKIGLGRKIMSNGLKHWRKLLRQWHSIVLLLVEYWVSVIHGWVIINRQSRKFQIQKLLLGNLYSF